jgi:hypothetical protein
VDGQVPGVVAVVTRAAQPQILALEAPRLCLLGRAARSDLGLRRARPRGRFPDALAARFATFGATAALAFARRSVAAFSAAS